MAPSQLSYYRTAIRDIVIVTTFFAANLALRHYSKYHTFSIRHIANNTSTSPTTGEHGCFRKFTSLPFEIRMIIYEHAMRQGGHFSQPTYVDPSTNHASYISSTRSNCLPNVCFTNKVENRVATSVFIQHATFHMSKWADAATMASWLSNIQEHGNAFRSVRNIELSYIPSSWPMGFSKHFELLRQCPGLRQLTLAIPIEGLDFVVFNDAYVPILRRPLTYIELLDKFELDAMFECAPLRRVTFKISSRYISQSQLESPLPVYRELTKLVRLAETAFSNRHRETLKFLIGFSNEQDLVFSVREL
jgi:hypothetical protein